MKGAKVVWVPVDLPQLSQPLGLATVYMHLGWVVIKWTWFGSCSMKAGQQFMQITSMEVWPAWMNLACHSVRPPRATKHPANGALYEV